MGNCLKHSTPDDISLLRGGTDMARESSIQDQLNAAGNADGSAVPSNVGGNNVNSTGGSASLYSEILQPVFYPTPSVSRPANHLTEEEQIKIAKRIGLIQHLPMGRYDGRYRKNSIGGSTNSNSNKKPIGGGVSRECVICMIEFQVNDTIRYLPCMHTYHVHCIDDWLMRSLTCPTCMEPVDAALLTTYETT